MILSLALALFGFLPQEKPVEVWSHFDGGSAPTHTIAPGVLTFNFSNDQMLPIHALLKNVPARFSVRVLAGKECIRHFGGQGIFTSKDGTTYAAIPWKIEGDTMTAELTGGGDVWIATNIPYARNALDQLYCDVSGAPRLHPSLLRKDHRIVPVFEFGEDDGKKKIHYIIGGECSRETAGCWAVDAMIRELATDKALATELLSNAVIRLIPHISPYASTMPVGSCITVSGAQPYGASTWGDPEPPTEVGLVRAKVIETIKTKRLGLLLTVHSWWALKPVTGMESIQVAGKNGVAPARKTWAEGVMTALTKDVPKAEWEYPQSAWHPGLARDYLLAEFNAVTFRVEITTVGQIQVDFQKTGRQLLRNVGRVADWTPALTP